MARRRRRSPRRDVETIANLVPQLPRRAVPTAFDFYRSALRPVEDRRTFHPEPYRRPELFPTRPRPARVIALAKQVSKPKALVRNQVRVAFPSARLGFVEPARTLICVRRKIRKAVLHATGRAGRRGQRKPRRNEHSEVKC